MEDGKSSPGSAVIYCLLWNQARPAIADNSEAPCSVPGEVGGRGYSLALPCCDAAHELLSLRPAVWYPDNGCPLVRQNTIAYVSLFFPQ